MTVLINSLSTASATTSSKFDRTNKSSIKLSNGHTLNLQNHLGRRSNVDCKNFFSLALFGLWGKSPEKLPQGTVETPIIQSTPNQTPSSPPPSTPTETAANASPVDLSNGYIPEPPPIVDENIILNALGEPTLQSLGLGSNWPSGLIQQFLEFAHVDFGLEWYQAIIMFAIGIRLCLFPLTVVSQQNAVKMRKISPQMMHYQEKISDAKATGNALEVATASQEMIEFMKISNFSTLKMLLPMIQVPIMLSTFLAIRGMARLPVESMTTGGALWFLDLTVADPFFLLPIMATASIVAIIHKGVDTGISASNMTPTTRLMFYGFGALSLPFFCFMPSGVSFYICVSNFISLIYSVIFSFKSIKRAFGIPVLSEYDLLKIKETQKKQKDFLKGFFDKYQNMKVVQEIKERERIQERLYKQASNKVPERTFRENPKLVQKKE